MKIVHPFESTSTSWPPNAYGLTSHGKSPVKRENYHLSQAQGIAVGCRDREGEGLLGAADARSESDRYRRRRGYHRSRNFQTPIPPSKQKRAQSAIKCDIRRKLCTYNLKL